MTTAEKPARSPGFEPLPPRPPLSDEERLARALELAADLRTRRTVRDFAPDPVPRAVIEACLDAAGSAPSGANRQPWRFVAISDPAIKARIRAAAEEEEEAFYSGRAPAEWLQALEPFGTTAAKPFLETAPWLIAVFAESWGVGEGGARIRNYYVTESVGLATGLLLAALHRAGLATLTHTPSPMRFLNEVLERPENERPFLLLVVGHPAPDARVPVIGKKGLEEYAEFLEAGPPGDARRGASR